MNGRLYDPKLHRFLQPDNYVQDPSNTQNYNRYGYCWNNPLKYTDPSGEIIPLVIAGIILVSAAVNIYQNWDDITGGTGKFSDIKWGKFLAYGGTGAVYGALTVYGGPYGVIWAGGFQSLSKSIVRGDDLGTTIQNTSIGVIGGALTMGVGDGLNSMYPNGIFNIADPVLKGGINAIVGRAISGFVTTSILSGSFKEGFKNTIDPVNIFSNDLLGSLEGANGIKQSKGNKEQYKSISESFNLNIMPLYVSPGANLLFHLLKFLFPLERLYLPNLM